MTDLLKEQFGEALTNFKMKNIDTASLQEIIGEFAPLIGVGTEDTFLKHQTRNSSSSSKNMKADDTPNNLNGLLKTKNDVLDPNTALDLSIKAKLPNHSTFSNAEIQKDSSDIVSPAYNESNATSVIDHSIFKTTNHSMNISSNNKSSFVEKIVPKSSPQQLQNNFMMDTPQMAQSTSPTADDGMNNSTCSKTSKALYEIKTVHDLKYYQCRMCPRAYDTKYHLNRHLISHGGNKPHHCESCGKSFSQKCDLNRHMNVHNNVRKHTCSVCSKSFKRADYLSKHEKQYCGVLKPHKCGKCSKGFEDVEQLNEHKRSHNETSFHCEHCSEEFNSVDKLVTHRKKHSKQNEEYTCTKCEDQFTDFTSYVDHFKRHSGERPYACDLCQKVFSRNHNLMTHMWIHNQEKQHTCPICAKTFTYYSNLQVHLRVHRNERPYKCEECKKGFLTSSDLRRHKRTHSGEKPYKCEHCPAEYARKERLLSHMITHFEEGSGERELSGDSSLSNGMNDEVSKESTKTSMQEDTSRDSNNMEEEVYEEEEDGIIDEEGDINDEDK